MVNLRVLTLCALVLSLVAPGLALMAGNREAAVGIVLLYPTVFTATVLASIFDGSVKVHAIFGGVCLLLSAAYLMSWSALPEVAVTTVLLGLAGVAITVIFDVSAVRAGKQRQARKRPA